MSMDGSFASARATQAVLPPRLANVPRADNVRAAKTKKKTEKRKDEQTRFWLQICDFVLAMRLKEELGKRRQRCCQMDFGEQRGRETRRRAVGV